MKHAPDFKAQLAARARAVEMRLEAALSPADGSAAWPPRLLAAMRHGVFNGGKRLRPFLLLESAALFCPAEAGGEAAKTMQAALEAAAALEAVHCYSLIHDDLPAMDNDDWRRGRPAVHKAYDEATALLAGNALLTLAFALLCRPDNGLPAARQAQLARHLAQAAGAGGMIGGQMLDILAEKQQKTAEEIMALDMMKTGALLRFACFGGAVAAQAPLPAQDLLAQFGGAVGFIFQLADDLLDLGGSRAALGKTPGKDAAQGKATFLSLYGAEKSRALLRAKLEEALDILSPFGAKADTLRQAARFIAARDH